jgi:hypothetical protein
MGADEPARGEAVGAMSTQMRLETKLDAIAAIDYQKGLAIRDQVKPMQETLVSPS